MAKIYGVCLPTSLLEDSSRVCKPTKLPMSMMCCTMVNWKKVACKGCDGKRPASNVVPLFDFETAYQMP